jgi:hypothetical protein
LKGFVGLGKFVLPSGAVPSSHAKSGRHPSLSFKDLGSWEPELLHAGYEIDFVDACTQDLGAVSDLNPELVILLGDPIGVYGTENYPFLISEMKLACARAGNPSHHRHLSRRPVDGRGRRSLCLPGTSRQGKSAGVRFTRRRSLNLRAVWPFPVDD